MKQPVVIIGIGEMGGVFARGFLRLGHPVYPVTRATTLASAAAAVAEPELVLLAVAEQDLRGALTAMPPGWRDKLVLLQNELLPNDWLQYGYTDPTVISVWFEKKPGQEAKVLLPSPVYGPHADRLREALGAIDIPARILASSDELLFELVRKNVYILTTNIAGLETGGTVSELWSQHRELAQAVAAEVIQLQERLSGRRFDEARLVEAMLEAFAGDPDHRCTGRSAPARLERTQELAEQFGLHLPTIASLGEKA